MIVKRLIFFSAAGTEILLQSDRESRNYCRNLSTFWDSFEHTKAEVSNTDSSHCGCVCFSFLY